MTVPIFMMAADATIVATALDALQRGLHTSIGWTAWTITAYSLGFVVMLPVSGKLSQRYGRKRVFMASLATFTTASLLCGLTSNIYLLIALRALQAIGGAGFTPSATGIIVDHFGDARDRAVALLGSMFPTGALIGPVLGGLIVSYWSWRGAFFINVPIGIAIGWIAWRHIPADQRRDVEARADEKSGMDFPGVALLGAGLLAAMLAASTISDRHASDAPLLFVGLCVAALAALSAFFRHIRRTARPFILPRFIYGKDFGAVNLFNALYGGATAGVITLVPLYATRRYALDTLASGTLLSAQGAATIVMTVIAALALRRTGHRLPLYAGGALIGVGTLLLALPPLVGIPAYAWLALSTFVIGIGFGAIDPASRNAGLQLAPQSASMLAALRTMCFQLGTIVTVSIVAALLVGAGGSALAQAWFYAAAAAIFVLALPMVALIPEHHGSW
ncbi:MAG TPA: MFS transporter [Nevskiaceae bacterium]